MTTPMTPYRIAEIATNATASTLLRINAPEWFADTGFIAWLNNDKVKATWHRPGTQPNEYSDVYVTYDSGEGSNANEDGEIPDSIWEQIIAIVKARFGTEHKSLLLQITNLQE